MALQIIKQGIRKTDNFVLRLLGEHKGPQPKIVMPKTYSALEVRHKFIEDYINAQPSMLRSVLLKTYVTARHMLGLGARQALRIYRIIAQ